jgi:uncharacterized protein (DUF2141 family)
LGLALLVLGLLSSARLGPPPARTEYDLTVVCANLPASGGTLFVGLWDQAEGFRAADAMRQGRRIAVSDQGRAHVTFADLPAGTYAVSSYLDANDNGQLDRNFLGLPSEPYGFSNNVYPNTRATRFDEAAFRLQSDAEITIRMQR